MLYLDKLQNNAIFYILLSNCLLPLYELILLFQVRVTLPINVRDGSPVTLLTNAKPPDLAFMASTISLNVEVSLSGLFGCCCCWKGGSPWSTGDSEDSKLKLQSLKIKR